MLRRCREFVLTFLVLTAPWTLAQVTETTLYNFTGGTDGAVPNPLVQGSDGNFYGTAVLGGNNLTTGACDQGVGCGTAFQITSSGSFEVIYTFCSQPTCSDGAYPNQLIEGNDGNYYGTTINGGSSSNCTDGQNNSNVVGCGVIFELTRTATGQWNEYVLYTFNAGVDGSHPVSLIQGSDGEFYGTTITTVFQMPSSGGSVNTLWTFSGQSDGIFPMGVVEGSPSLFYGVTQFGGYFGNNACNVGQAFGGCGTIFNITSTGTLNTIYAFTGRSDGSETRTGGGNGDVPNPVGGKFYIVVQQGGGGGGGHHWCQNCQVTPPSVIANALVEYSDGTFWGTTKGDSTINGTIFDVTPSGQLITQYTFSGPALPDPLWLGSDGNFYGQDVGSVFQISPAGNFTTFYTLAGNIVLSFGDAVIQGSDGDFYGPGDGGNNGQGAIYELASSPPLAPSVAMSLSPSPITYGSSATLSWNVSNGFSTTLQQCYASVQGALLGAGIWAGLQNGVSGSSGFHGSSTLTPTSNGTFTYALTCGGSESGFATLAVSQATTTTSLASSANPSQVSEPVTYTATVASQYGGGVTGSVNFLDGDVVQAMVPLSNGQAQYSTMYTSPATHSITAAYLGDPNNVGSMSSVLKQVVEKAITTTQLTSSLNPTYVNQPVTFTATVTNPYGTPVGNITFRAGLKVLGKEALLNGVATLTEASPIKTVVKVTASYSGNNNFTPSSGSVIQKVLPSPNFVTLYSFGSAPDGENPLSGVILDPAGNMYGATRSGGTNNLGTVFEVKNSGIESIVHSFTGPPDGAYSPYWGTASLIRDSFGNLYGTTSAGGAYSAGTVFEVSPAGIETVLYSFTGGADGGQPLSSLLQDSAGNLYGTTYIGGDFACQPSYGCGTIFELTQGANNQWTETVLYSFQDANVDGAFPETGLVQDSQGNFYGTANIGPCCGLVFQLTPAGVENVLYEFTGSPNDGSYPESSLILDEEGNLYGTTEFGGIPSCYSNFGCGIVFKVDLHGNETVLYRFTGETDGGNPSGALLPDSSGNFYGVTAFGGMQGLGTVYELSAAEQELVLYSFTGQGDGGGPNGALVKDAAGNLFGTGLYGGSLGYGTVFKIIP